MSDHIKSQEESKQEHKPFNYDTIPFKGMYMPAEILRNPFLNSIEKLILSEIHMLCSDKHSCIRTNTQWAKNYIISIRQVNKIISRLKEEGYIKIKYIEKGREIRDYINLNKYYQSEGLPLQYPKGYKRYKSEIDHTEYE